MFRFCGLSGLFLCAFLLFRAVGGLFLLGFLVRLLLFCGILGSTGGHFFVIFSALRAQLAVAGGFGGFGLGYIFQRKFCQGLVTGQSMTKFILKNASSIEILSKIMPIWVPWGHQGPRTPRDAVEVAKR